MAFDDSDKPRPDAAFVGKALPGITVSADEKGRIHVSGDSRASGSDIPEWEGEFGGGLYRTHDIGAVRDREIFIHRCDGGAINVAGRKVSPARLRAILESIPGVLAAEVGSGPSLDFERFEEIRVRVDIAPGFDAKDVRERLRQATESWEMPRKWEFGAITPR